MRTKFHSDNSTDTHTIHLNSNAVAEFLETTESANKLIQTVRTLMENVSPTRFGFKQRQQQQQSGVRGASVPQHAEMEHRSVSLKERIILLSREYDRKTKMPRSKPCPIDCEMNEWSPWSQCSATCGGGTRTRTRTVKKNSEHGGKTCGKDFEEEECNKKPCPVNCKLNEWSTWSECKVDDAVAARCGGGTRTRTRTIKEKAQHGGTCDVELEEKQECGAGTWVPMSTCDAKCGGGKITETFLPITLGPNCNHKEGATREKIATSKRVLRWTVKGSGRTREPVRANAAKAHRPKRTRSREKHLTEEKRVRLYKPDKCGAN